MLLKLLRVTFVIFMLQIRKQVQKGWTCTESVNKKVEGRKEGRKKRLIPQDHIFISGRARTQPQI